MAPVLPVATRTAIQQALQLAQDNNQKPNVEAIAAIFYTSDVSVYRIRRRMIDHAQNGFHPKRAGPKPAMKTPEQEALIAAGLKEYIEQNVHSDQAAISAWAEHTYDVKLSQSSWSRFMKKHNVPHKTANRFFPKSRLVGTRDKPARVVRRKKKTDGGEEGMVDGEGVVLDTQVPQYVEGQTSNGYAPLQNPSLGSPPDYPSNVDTNHLSLDQGTVVQGHQDVTFR